MSISRLAAVLALTVAAAACDDEPAGPDNATGYDVTVSGDVAARARGAAFFGADTDESGAPIFGIALGDESSQHTIVLAKEGAQAPAAGEYRIRTPGTGGAGWDAAYILTEGDDLMGVLVADSGKIVITQGNATRLRGTIDLYATGLLEDEEGFARVRLQGTFSARPAPVAVALANRKRF